jgi:hypothetical protein
MLRAYYSKNNGKLMWENTAANTTGLLNRRRLVKDVGINRNGKPVYNYKYIFPTGRIVDINMWRVFVAPERKKKPVPTPSPYPLTFPKKAVPSKNAKLNGGLARALRNPNSTNAIAATLKVLSSPNLMRNLNINNIIKILSVPHPAYPPNKLSNLRNILVNKLLRHGSANNIHNASMEVNFTNSQNAKLTNALMRRGFT